MRRAAVIVASTSAAAGLAADRTGPEICAWLAERGFAVAEPIVVADGVPVDAALRGILTASANDSAHDPVSVVITTGGTGVSPDDRTPDVVAPLLDVQLPGIVEEIRRRGTPHTPNAILTRGVAGFAGATFVLTLPGSPGGVRDGLAVLDTVLEHLLGQRTGTTNGRHHGKR